MASELTQKRKGVHRRVAFQFSELVSTLCAFVVIFAVLMTIANWPAYSRIIQSWIDPAALKPYVAHELSSEEQAFMQQELSQHFHQQDQLFNSSELEEGEVFDPNQLGALHPDEMRISIPKLFGDESLPVKKVTTGDFNFADLYNSENKIQEALRDGVVHYPFTADPDEFGNVFITGHSSYYPWDKGRYKEIFALLHLLEVGDEYTITHKGNEYRYIVRDIFEVEPDDTSVLNQPHDKRISTLMTCTPVGTTLRRLIVQAEGV